MITIKTFKYPTKSFPPQNKTSEIQMLDRQARQALKLIFGGLI